MLARVTKLGFLGLGAVKYDEMLNHYRSIVGLPVFREEPQETLLSCGVDARAVSLRRSDKPGIRYLGFVIEGEGDLSDIAADARKAGYSASLKSDAFDGIPSAVEVNDPDGYTIYLYRQGPAATTPYGNSGVRPNKLGHVALLVGDAQKAAKYYTDILGFRWSDWLGDFFVFMRCNTDHHTMNFLRSEKSGMFHVAFELLDMSHLGRSCDVLAQHRQRIIWGPGRHGMGHNLFVYHRDPDGNIIEFFAELDRMSDENLGYFDSRPYHADLPQRPKIWSPEDPMAANSWGAPTPEEMR
ncbi:MAG TPA: VOC family protein [Hyphomicrobiales bacterium]|nr:VOC family protein [Hyphomicrobiales bacterium]